MQEFQIVELIFSGLDQAWSSLEWWASVSFGLIALTHFAAKKLNLTIVIAVSVLYILFTIYSGFNVAISTGKATFYIQDMRALAESGAISSGGIGTMDQMRVLAPPAVMTMILCAAGTFLGTLAYLVFSYRRERTSS